MKKYYRNLYITAEGEKIYEKSSWYIYGTVLGYCNECLYGRQWFCNKQELVKDAVGNLRYCIV